MTTAHLEDIRDHIVLARTPANPLAPPDVFATTIATLQSKTYLRRVSRVFDFCILVLATIAGALRRKNQPRLRGAWARLPSLRLIVSSR